MQTLDITQQDTLPEPSETDVQLVASMRRDYTKQLDSQTKSRVKSVGTLSSPEVTRRIKHSTPRDVTKNTNGAALYGCVYPQGKDIAKSCIPECVEGIKMPDTDVCDKNVYVVGKNDTVKKINEGEGGTHVYITGKTSIRKTHIAQLSKEGVTEFTAFTAKGDGIAYEKVGEYTTKKSTTQTQETPSTLPQSISNPPSIIRTYPRCGPCSGDKSDSSESSWSGRGKATTSLSRVDDSSSRGKSVSFSPETVDNHGKTAQLYGDCAEEDKGGWGWVIVVAVVILLLLIVASVICYWLSRGASKDVAGVPKHQPAQQVVR